MNQDKQRRPGPLDLEKPFTLHSPLAWLATLHLNHTGSREETRVARTLRCRRNLHQSPKVGVATRILQEVQPRNVGQRHAVAAVLLESGKKKTTRTHNPQSHNSKTLARRSVRKRSAAPSGTRRARFQLQVPVSFFQILKFQILEF